MSTRTLEVWCFDELAGVLADAADGLTFAYAPDWFAAGRPPLSQSLPLDGAFAPAAAGAFFGGLLPEGAPRELLARELGVSSDNDFSLLAALAGDTAGAITLVVPGEGPPTSHAPGDDVTWLDDAKLAAEIERLPTRPMHVDADGEYRLSLAGAQDKLPVVVGADGRVGLTKGWTPSTHILKTPIANLENTVANEAMCLDLGRRLGIPVAVAVPRRAGDRECLLVTRYDREGDEHGGTRRLHQEDFCQALGIPAARKYQAEGGPTLPDCFALLRRASRVPAADAVHLLDQVTLSFLVGNHDAHAKNYSLLLAQDQVRLAPLYDVASALPYGTHERKLRLAMKIGGDYGVFPGRNTWPGASRDLGLDPDVLLARVLELGARAPDAFADAANQPDIVALERPMPGRLVDLVAERATRCRRLIESA